MDYEVRFDITVPENIEQEEIMEWIKFELEIQASIKTSKELLGLSWDDLKPRFLIVRKIG